MARIIEHLDTLREKPEHVRHTIALGVAGGITALVALGWVTAMATSDTFALKTGTPAEPIEVKEAPKFSNLVGSVGAAFGASSTEPALTTITETRSSSTITPGPQNGTSERVIAF